MKSETRKYHIIKETFDEQLASGRYNPALVLVIAGKRFTLGSGYDDHRTVLRYDKNIIAVLATQPLMGYAGLDLFNAVTGEAAGYVFFNNTDELETKKDFFDYTPNAQADFLAQYIVSTRRA